MSGVVEVVLTDKELDILIAWAEDGVPSGFSFEQDERLLTKLQGYKHALECRPEVCAPRDLDPNAP